VVDCETRAEIGQSRRRSHACTVQSAQPAGSARQCSGKFLRLAAAGLVDGAAVHLREQALEPGVHQRAEGVGQCDRVGATGFG
jgi:hypothetical protein